jgi:hypothetical protein
MSLTEEKQMKYCSKCEEVKEMTNNFYRTGATAYQKYCKICHNERRSLYKSNSVYIPKTKKGFAKLPEELQKMIVYDIYVRINFKDIIRKYIVQYPNLRHQSLMRWNRLKQIPKYIPEPDKTDKTDKTKTETETIIETITV